MGSREPGVWGHQSPKVVGVLKGGFPLQGVGVWGAEPPNSESGKRKRGRVGKGGDGDTSTHPVSRGDFPLCHRLFPSGGSEGGFSPLRGMGV